MLFFRSEDMIDAWCGSRGHPKRPVVTVDQLWRLSVLWNRSRLDPLAPRPAPNEVRGIFARAGLDGDFWDPLSDAFA